MTIRHRPAKKVSKPTTKVTRWLAILRLPIVNDLLADYVLRRIASQAGLGDQSSILAIIQIFTDEDYQKNRSDVLELLKNCSNRDLLFGLWKKWIDSRSPDLLLCLKKLGKPSLVPGKSKVFSHLLLNLPITPEPEDIPGLIDAIRDKKNVISNSAKLILLNLNNQGCINRLCQEWVDSRSYDIQEVIQSANYGATRPIYLSLLIHLLNERIEKASEITPDDLPSLIKAIEDPSPQIQENAIRSLSALTNLNTQRSLCRFAVKFGSEILISIAKTAGYLPDSPEDQALWYFLSNQTDQYESLDFDFRLMKFVYRTEEETIRQRIIKNIQDSGKSSYLNIISGSAPQKEDFSLEEFDVSARVFQHNHDWSNLWNLAINAYPLQAIQWIKTLIENGWTPGNDAERDIFEQIRPHLEKINGLLAVHFFNDLPFANHTTSLKLNGRVNDIAISPNNRLVAIATSARQVVLWDLELGQIRSRIKGFSHPCKNVLFTHDQEFIAVEKGLVNSTCGIYKYKNCELSQIGVQTGSIASIILWTEKFLISSGRDGYLRLWDIEQKVVVKAHQMGEWARFLTLSADGKYLGALVKSPQLFTLPDFSPVSNQLNRIKSSSSYPKGIIRCAIPIPDNSGFFVGLGNGNIEQYLFDHTGSSHWKNIKRSHSTGIQALQTWQNQSILISASKDGLIGFSDINDGKWLGSVHQPGDTLTSLIISSDENIMATGRIPSEVWFWDLRLSQLPSFLSIPLVKMGINNLHTLTDLVQTYPFKSDDKELILILKALLELKFRYTIEIEDKTYLLKPGEFEIEISD